MFISNSKEHGKMGLRERMITEVAKQFDADYRKKFGKAPTDYKSRSIYDVLLIAADAINRAGLNPAEVNRNLHLLVDGQIVADMRDAGEKVEVRVRARPRERDLRRASRRRWAHRGPAGPKPARPPTTAAPEAPFVAPAACCWPASSPCPTGTGSP